MSKSIDKLVAPTHSAPDLITGMNADPAGQVVVRLVPTEEYRGPRTHLFPSRESLAWFIRRHRDDLVSGGALRIPTGRWLVDPELFDRFVLSLESKRGLPTGRYLSADDAGLNDRGRAA